MFGIPLVALLSSAYLLTFDLHSSQVPFSICLPVFEVA